MGFVDDGHVRRIASVGILEQASAAQRNPHGFEIAGRQHAVVGIPGQIRTGVTPSGIRPAVPPSQVNGSALVEPAASIPGSERTRSSRRWKKAERFVKSPYLGGRSIRQY
jgi:hypothetical protein